MSSTWQTSPVSCERKDLFLHAVHAPRLHENERSRNHQFSSSLLNWWSHELFDEVQPPSPTNATILSDKSSHDSHRRLRRTTTARDSRLDAATRLTPSTTNVVASRDSDERQPPETQLPLEIVGTSSNIGSNRDRHSCCFSLESHRKINLSEPSFSEFSWRVRNRRFLLFFPVQSLDRKSGWSRTLESFLALSQLSGIVARVALRDLKMSMASESSWVGRKPVKRIGGMSDALSIAADLGFSMSPPPSQEGLQNSSPTTGEKGEDLIRVLRELTTVQRKIADLQVELQGRKDDKNVAHLTHVSEMEKKIETLARITTILKDVIQNKDRIIARLQQPYSLDCIPVEAEYQKQFSELLMKAASDYGALTASVADFQWSQNFKEPPSVWGEMLRPIPVALASCTRFFEAMSATRESFATLQKLRVGHFDSPLPRTPAGDPSQRVPGVSDCLTPPPWKTEANCDDLGIRNQRRQHLDQVEDVNS